MSQLEVRQQAITEKGYPLRLLSAPSNRDSKHLLECTACLTQFERPLSKILSRGQSGCTNSDCEHSSTAKRAKHAATTRKVWKLPANIKMIEQGSGNNPSLLECVCGAVLSKVMSNFERRATDQWCDNPDCSHWNPKFQDAAHVESILTSLGVTPRLKSYQNSDSPLDFLCKCGKPGVTNYRFLIKRNRHGIAHPPTCPDCKDANRPRGEDSPTWDHSITTEQRVKERRVWDEEGFPYKSWRRSVHIRDSGRCVISGLKSKPEDPIRVHHIFNYRHHVEGRLMTANGVCLTESLHRQFHTEYGHGKNTLRQFKEFYSRIKGQPYINAELELAAIQFGWDHD